MIVANVEKAYVGLERSVRKPPSHVTQPGLLKGGSTTGVPTAVPRVHDELRWRVTKIADAGAFQSKEWGQY